MHLPDCSPYPVNVIGFGMDGMFFEPTQQLIVILGKSLTIREYFFQTGPGSYYEFSQERIRISVTVAKK
jgi:hypothetical protein